MKYFALAILLMPLFLSAQSNGTVKTDSFFSPALSDSMNYTVFLPSGYDSGTAPYPVFLLLHGYTGNHTDWVQQENSFVLATSDSLNQLPVYITCGDDRLYHHSVSMYDTLNSRGYPAELRITDGAHTWEVWAREIAEVIKFFNSEAVRKE